MKKILSIIIIAISYSSCLSQNIIVKDLSSSSGLNYILSNIWEETIIGKELWNGGQYVKIFKISDSKVTPEEYFQVTGEILSSLIISSTPDGDYYTTSKLYKIEGIYNPKVLEIKEEKYPIFSVKFEHGFYGKRKTEVLKFGNTK